MILYFAMHKSDDTAIFICFKSSEVSRNDSRLIIHK